jgi:hypothetical protein
MKIIITERQYKILQESDKIKKLVNSMINDEELSIDEIIAYTGLDEGEIIELLGGWDEMIEKSYELMDRVFDTMDYDFRGGYDFRFKPQINLYYGEYKSFFVNCPIESDGKVTLITDGETHLLSKVEEDEDLWWEVEGEISTLIYDILHKEVIKKTGIRVDINNCWIEE